MKVRYDPYTMDCFHYERIVNGKSRWLPVDNVGLEKFIYVENGKPVISDIDIDNDDTNSQQLFNPSWLLKNTKNYLVEKQVHF